MTIDVSGPVKQLCELLGVEYSKTAWIYIDPGAVVARVYVPNKHGSIQVDLVSRSAVTKLHLAETEVQLFEVST